jgi:cytosine/adenosine deaminase-related metal-dependent hydrolase
MGARVRVDGVDLELSGLQILPGLVNAHDHLHFSLFPRLGAGPYTNAIEWARAIYHPEEEPVRSHLAVPKRLRLIWGGLRNLLAGVTTVCHHDECHPAFDENFPVGVLRRFGWAHSLEFTSDVRACFERTPPDAPFIIHLGEGTDEDAASEIFRLDEIGALTERTVLVHAVGLMDEGWKLVRRRGAGVIWCPRSNLFTLGRTLQTAEIPPGVAIALGTDSSLTTEGDLLDEISFVQKQHGCTQELVSNARKLLGLSQGSDDWIAVRAFGCPPELVVISGQIRLISARLAAKMDPVFTGQFHMLNIQGRPPVFIRWDIPLLIEQTRPYLSPIRLAGREVCASTYNRQASA